MSASSDFPIDDQTNSDDEGDGDSPYLANGMCLMTSECADSIFGDHVLLDFQSGVNVVKDRVLLSNVRPADTPMRISGIAGGKSLVSLEIGDMKYFGVCYFHPQATANVLNATQVEDKFIGAIEYKQQRYLVGHVMNTT